MTNAGLTEGDHPSGQDARSAITRLVHRSQQRRPADAVALVDDARAALDPHR